MTNYKRFVSYFYQYDSGRKNNNTGYARIETSDEMCKVSLNCNLRTIPGRVCRVYFVKRNRDQTEGIMAGTAVTKTDGVEARVTMPKGVIEDTNVRFYEITGIVVCFSKDNYFVTEWDNIPITYHQVASFEDKTLDVREEAKEKTEPEKQPSVVEIVDTKTEEMIGIIEIPSERKNQTDAKDTLSVEDKAVREDTIVLDENRDEDIGTAEQIASETSGIEEEASKEEDIKAANLSDTPSTSEISEVSNDEGTGDEVKAANTEEEFKVSCIEAALTEAIDEDELILDDNDELVNVADCNATPSLSEKEGWCDHPSARSVMDRFPHMYPFDDGEITECVRIEPKDLGLLPIDAWVLGNNSFLLHSFCTYRHLLFAKKISREGIYYMVMVPGAYNAREKHMAGMFGFKDFKCSRRRKLRDGDFGYWYIYIDYSSVCTC